MNEEKRKRLEMSGWEIGSAKEFLNLSDEESAYIELKLYLSEKLRERRNQLHLTQQAVAERMNSSQSRVAKMEAADPSVSLDLIIRTLLILGASNLEIASAIKTVPHSRAS